MPNPCFGVHCFFFSVVAVVVFCSFWLFGGSVPLLFYTNGGCRLSLVCSLNKHNFIDFVNSVYVYNCYFLMVLLW